MFVPLQPHPQKSIQEKSKIIQLITNEELRTPKGSTKSIMSFLTANG